ncbi:MAG: flagellar biosynthesis protein FlhB [Campylobacterales bacterium]
MAADEEERTEEPTSKRIEDARKEGNVARSMDLVAAISLTVSIMAAIALLGFMIERMGLLFRYYWGLIGQELSVEMELEIAIVTARELFLIIVPFAFVIMIAGIAAHVLQFGFLFTTKPLIPDFKKLDPIAGLKNLFSLKKIVEGIKTTLKVATAFIIGAVIFWGFVEELPTVALFDFYKQLEWLSEKAIELAMVMLAIFIVFGAIDLLWQRYSYFKSLRMTKQEIKDEFKQQEGNPEIRRKIRQLQMEMSRKRMMSEIPTASVVVTNPTHYAVAIRYEQGKDRAPKVVAAGVDLLALRIKEIARQHFIPIVENPPLARSLYKQCDPGDEIPEELYKAVAEVLAFVYRTNRRNQARYV